ncbi:MAG: ATP synthase F1 subunit gamma [Planctomycetes bacterium]|nr:ATP synthase F1 subunit gamma [Planctomycetota bacterium]
MAKLRALVQRRKAVRNIRKITRTMELIATARFKKALDRATAAEAYTHKIAEIAADLTKNASDVSHPLLVVRPVKKSLLLILCSNRGLCGGYNGSIIREAVIRTRQMKSENTPYDMELSGKRAIAFFRYQGIKGTHSFTQFDDKPSFAEVEQIADRYIKMYTSGQIDRVEVAYMRFINASKQEAVVETLLPLSGVAEDISRHKAAATGSNDPYEFLPNASEILEEIVPAAFKARLFKCFLDAAVSEQIARRISMKAATENAADLIRALSQQYNRARQANITKEISELIAGSEALK